MLKVRLVFLILGLCLSASAQDLDTIHNRDFNENLSLALKGLKMTNADLSLRDDYLEKDVYRISLIDSFMYSPLEMVSKSQNLLDGEVPDYSNMYFGILRRSAFSLNVPVSHLLNRSAPQEVVAKYTKPLDLDLTTLYRLAFFISGTESYSNDVIFREDYSEHFDSLVYGFTILLEEDVEDEFRSVDELDSIQDYEEEWASQLAEITKERIEPEAAPLMGKFFMSIFEDSVINDTNLNDFKFNYIEFETPFGKVCLGDSTSQNYSGDLFVVIDYGGDDTYNIEKSGKCNFTFILDYGGNDIYNMPKNRISPYAMGVNVMIDFSGDDNYFAGSWALGAGFFGTGILWDKCGNDHYYGDTFTMGAGCFGYGILRDDEGDDFYQSALFSQGFGFVEGIGVLIDNAGNDHYFAGGKYKDILRYEDHYLSLSQGFAYGIRPYMSGGVGYLVDKSGNDTYESDIFGQGCSYWWSLGILADGGGNDKYLSFQYAQGSATHMALGCLYDAGGNDNYIAKGVSQGCGHDRAVGLLYDAFGDDDYIAYDLSQGAGSANGIGIIADLEGIDSYLVKKANNTQGYGNPRREYGSIGIFLDIGGAKDTYAGGEGADSTWWSGSKWGIGIDK